MKSLGLVYGLRFAVLERDQFTCQYCGRQAPDVILEVDHRMPIIENGPTVMENLVTACSACNQGKRLVPMSIASLTAVRLGSRNPGINPLTMQPGTIGANVLALLQRSGPMRNTAIAKAVEKDTATVRMVLHRLFNAGLVSRQGLNWKA